MDEQWEAVFGLPKAVASTRTLILASTAGLIVKILHMQCRQLEWAQRKPWSGSEGSHWTRHQSFIAALQLGGPGEGAEETGSTWGINYLQPGVFNLSPC